MERVNTCKDCKTKFHPDARCEEYCPRCNAEYEIRHGYRDSDGSWVPGEDDWQDGDPGEPITPDQLIDED